MKHVRLGENHYVYEFSTGSPVDYELEVNNKYIYLRAHGVFKGEFINDEYYKLMESFPKAINHAKNAIVRDLEETERSFDEFTIMRNIDDVVRFYKFI